MRLKNFGSLPSMRNPPTRRVVRRAWTVGRLTGSLPFPHPCRLIQTPGFSKRHSHDAEFTLPRRSRRAVKFARSPASEQSAHHAADHANWTADTAVTASTAPTTGRSGFSGFVAGAGTRARRWRGFRQQRLMLQRVEEAGLGIAACRLPARDHSAGRLVELSVGPGVEAETRQPALHVFTHCPVEADLIFGFLGCFVGKDHHWIDAFRQVAGSCALTLLQRGDPRQGDRFELTVGIAG